MGSRRLVDFRFVFGDDVYVVIGIVFLGWVVGVVYVVLRFGSGYVVIEDGIVVKVLLSVLDIVDFVVVSYVVVCVFVLVVGGVVDELNGENVVLSIIDLVFLIVLVFGKISDDKRR